MYLYGNMFEIIIFVICRSDRDREGDNDSENKCFIYEKNFTINCNHYDSSFV